MDELLTWRKAHLHWMASAAHRLSSSFNAPSYAHTITHPDRPTSLYMTQIELFDNGRCRRLSSLLDPCHELGSLLRPSRSLTFLRVSSAPFIHTRPTVSVSDQTKQMSAASLFTFSSLSHHRNRPRSQRTLGAAVSALVRSVRTRPHLDTVPREVLSVWFRVPSPEVEQWVYLQRSLELGSLEVG